MKTRIEDEGAGDGNKEQEDMEHIQKDFQKNKDIVVDLLVKNVLSVNIEIPKVVKGEFWEIVIRNWEVSVPAKVCIMTSQILLIYHHLLIINML